MKIAVAGCTGYIGSSLVNELLSEGHHVLCITRSSTQHGYLQNIRPQNVTYTTYDDLHSNLYSCQVLINVSGLAHRSPLPLEETMRALFQSNVKLTSQILHASITANIKKYIHLSSVSIYGNTSAQEIIDEFSAPSPSSIYGCSKYISELLVHSLLCSTDVDYCILRAPMVYGPNCPGNFKALFSFFRFSPINIWSNVVAQRSFISIRHLVSVLSSISCPSFRPLRRTFIISDSTTVSVSQLASSFYRLRNYPVLSIPFSPFILRFLFSLFGRTDSWEKISNPFILDPSLFHRACDCSRSFSNADHIVALYLNRSHNHLLPSGTFLSHASPRNPP